MKKTEYGIYGTEGKDQLFCELVIFHDVPGIGYVNKQTNRLVSFMSRKDLLKKLDDGPYRYINDDNKET